MGCSYGLPCLGGIAGSRLVPVVVRRFGQRHVLLVVGAARTLWLPPYPLAPHGPTGPVIITAADAAMLTCAGVCNPVFVAYRMDVTAAAVRPAYAPARGISAGPCSHCSSSRAAGSPRSPASEPRCSPSGPSLT